MVRIELCGRSLDGAIEALRSNKDEGGDTYSRQYVFRILAVNSGVKIGKSVYVPAKSGEDYAKCHRFRLVGRRPGHVLFEYMGVRRMPVWLTMEKGEHRRL